MEQGKHKRDTEEYHKWISFILIRAQTTCPLIPQTAHSVTF